jgi:hypothetical protein
MSENTASAGKPKKRAKLEKKKSATDASVTQHDDVTLRQALARVSRTTGLSVFMLDVLNDILNDSEMTVTDVVCPNPQIVALNQALLEKYRAEMVLAKAQKDKEDGKPVQPQPNFADDAVRKYIVSQHEKKLGEQGVVVAGSQMREKMPLAVRDQQMLQHFLGYGETSTGYYVYMYYTGPSNAAPDQCSQYQKDLRNWHIVPRTHLSHFHRRLQPVQQKQHLTISSDQLLALNDTWPAFDPRFALHRWLESKEGKQHKQLVQDQRGLFRQHRDYLLKYYENHTLAASPYYYQPSETNVTATATTIEMILDEKPVPIRHDSAVPDRHDNEAPFEIQSNRAPAKKPRKKPERPVLTPEKIERDRQRQALRGYEVLDDEYRLATIEEFPELSKRPLARQDEDLAFTVEDLRALIARQGNFNTKRSPEQYTWKTDLLLRALLNAFNPEAKATQTLTSVCDDMLQILERDNAMPIFHALLNNPAACEKVQESTREFLYSCLAIWFASQVLPGTLEAALQQKGGDFMLAM